jgi:hypothetical protein
VNNSQLQIFYYFGLNIFSSCYDKHSWDEWVPETRTLKYNEENLKRQADLNESLQAKKAKSKKSVQESAAVEKSGSTHTKKRIRDQGERVRLLLFNPSELMKTTARRTNF